ncbi:MAG: DNA repair protein RadC [Anaerolineae bacterium]
MSEAIHIPYQAKVKELPEGERPRERLQQYGAEVLSTGELLAIVIGTGAKGEGVLTLAQRLQAEFQGLPGLARASFAEISQTHGIGLAKTARLKAALELGRRLQAAAPDDRPQIRSPADVAHLLQGEMGLLEQEEMRVLLLDTRSRVLAIPTVYKGSLNTTLVRIGELFREAIRANAAAVILVHNHPSGDASPSPDDVEITRQVTDAGRLLDIRLLDHVILAQAGYVSLKERGLGFGPD